jgi:hypothetical protein
LSAGSAPPSRHAAAQDSGSRCCGDTNDSGVQRTVDVAQWTTRSASVKPRSRRPLSECTGVFSRETTTDDDLDDDEARTNLVGHFLLPA